MCHHNVPFEGMQPPAHHSHSHPQQQPAPQKRSVTFEEDLRQQEASLAGEKYSQNIGKIPFAKIRQGHAEPVAAAIVAAQQHHQQQQHPQKAKISAADKFVIAIAPSDVAPSAIPMKSGLNRSNSVAGTQSTQSTAATGTTTSLHKSQSFSAEKSLRMSSSSRMQQLQQPKKSASSSAAAANSGLVSENDIQKARSQLKPSRSFPSEFSTGNEDQGDNSSSGVSSDQEVNSLTNHHSNPHSGNSGSSSSGKKFVTYVPVDGSTVGAASAAAVTTTTTTSSSAISNTSRVNWENNSESSDDINSEKSWILKSEQDNVGRNIISMKKMLHPKLQAIFDSTGGGSQTLPTSLKSASSRARLVEFADHDSTMSSMSSNSSNTSTGSHHHSHHHHHPQQQQQQQNYSSQTLPSRGHHKAAAERSHSTAGGEDQRSISQSLALIQQHVHSLGEVNTLAGVEKGAGKPEVPILAPPAGFSDSEANYSDNDSLSSGGSQKKFGFTRVTPTSRNIPKQSLTDQLKAERHHATLAKQAASKAASTKSQQQQQQQQNLMTRSIDSTLGNQLFNDSSAMTRSVDFSLVDQATQLPPPPQSSSSGGKKQKEFRTKPLLGWTTTDVCDWLDSLFMPEYKPAFIQNQVNGLKLASLTKLDWENLGVLRVGHMMNIEKSLKRHLAA